MKEIRLHTAALYQAGEVFKGDDELIIESGDNLHIFLPSETSLKDFEKKLFLKVKQKSLFTSLWSRADAVSVLLFSLGISLSIAILLGLVALYEDLFKALVVTGKLKTTGEVIWFAVCAILFVLLATFVPSLLSGEDSRIRDWIDQWYMRSHRVRRRIQRCLGALVHEGTTVSLWNTCAFSSESWVWQSLVPALGALPGSCEMYIRGDNRRHITGRLEKALPDAAITSSREETASDRLPVQRSLPGLMRLLDDSERLMLDLLIYLSTSNLPAAWKGKLQGKGFDVSDTVSPEVSEMVLSRHSAYLMPDMESGSSSSLTTMINSCLRDYRLMDEQRVKNYRLLKFVSSLVAGEEVERVNGRFPYLQDRLQGDLLHFGKQVKDPVAILVLLGFGEKTGASMQVMSGLLDLLIAAAREAEMYYIIQPFWGIFAEEKSEGFYRSLSLKSLQHLVVLYERAGMFQQALHLARYLQPVNRSKYKLSEGRLLERLGRYGEAVDLFLKDACLTALADKPEQQGEKVLSYYLQMSWTIVSGRLTEYREIGRNALQAASKLLETSLDEVQDPNMLWHYHNNLANYAEWDGELERSVIELQRCLHMPGVELKWISGTYVNLGITHRLLFIKNKEKGVLTESIRDGFEGVRLKREIGDQDELPIALHNAALNVIEALISGFASEYHSELATALEMCGEGLEVLDHSGSIKKKGMLLAERSLLMKLHSSGIVSGAEQEKADKELWAWMNETGEGDDDLQTARELLRRAEDAPGS